MFLCSTASLKLQTFLINRSDRAEFVDFGIDAEILTRSESKML